MSIKKIFAVFLLLVNAAANAQTFQTVETEGLPSQRHECAAAVVNDYLYLFGGRGNRPVNRFSFKSNKWDSVAAMPMLMNHFQATVYNDEVFIAGAFTGNYPHETPIANLYAFNTKNHTWRIETTIPAERLRGAAASVVHQNKLYLIAGVIDGHYDGHVTWMDVYDFKTKKWTQLAEAPHARDHFQAVVVNNKIYMAGGRRSSAVSKQVFLLTVPEVDVYDIASNRWITLGSTKNIPTQRAGCTSVLFGKNAFMVIGGESGKQDKAHNEAEVFNVITQQWDASIKLQQGRHGTQAVLYNNKIFIVTGSANKGGGPELNNMEMYKVK